MKTKKFPLLTQKEQSRLYESLYYLKMAELKKVCVDLLIDNKGSKDTLIKKIMQFIQTGQIITTPSFPPLSCAKNRPPQSLEPSSLMLYGSYKNDLKTRTFFKKLIGTHFHFTAFGIDWLRDRWLLGMPPTYQEFAEYWILETAARKQKKQKPKDEWMYIRFMQKMKQENPSLTKDKLLYEWKCIREKKADNAFKLLEKVKNSLSI